MFLQFDAETLISIVGSQWAGMYELLVCTAALNEWPISQGEGKIAWLEAWCQTHETAHDKQIRSLHSVSACMC